MVLGIYLTDAFIVSMVIGTLTSEVQDQQKREYGSWQWVVELSGPDDGLQSPRRPRSSMSSKRSFRLLLKRNLDPVLHHCSQEIRVENDGLFPLSTAKTLLQP